MIVAREPAEVRQAPGAFEQVTAWLPSALDVEVPLWLAMGLLFACALGAAMIAVVTWL